LINRGIVFINGVRTTNPYLHVKVGDVVQLIISDNFFTFFKISTNKKLKLLNSLKHIIWKNNRFRNNFYKQQYNRVPDWVSALSSFYDDVSAYIDVDYTVLSFCLINSDEKFNFLKKTNLKFINLFMLRNYNWNYLT
jgi:ribosomal protein S4